MNRLDILFLKIWMLILLSIILYSLTTFELVLPGLRAPDTHFTGLSLILLDSAIVFWILTILVYIKKESRDYDDSLLFYFSILKYTTIIFGILSLSIASGLINLFV